jgi:cysteine-rich repeat protein
MNYRALGAIVFVCVVGCGGDPMDADGGLDGSTDCTGAADGTSCGGGNICVGGTCGESRCGDDYIDTAAGEECEDGNPNAFDGCEPATCEFSCHAGECADAESCDGEEVCSDTTHVCVDVADLENGAECTRAGGEAGVCNAGVCVEAGCGNGVVEAPEDCDDGNATQLDGCQNDCRFSCRVDPTVENVWYLDCDGDGYSARNPEPREQCEEPDPESCGGGWTLLFPADGLEDCDDADETRHPNATELCDTIDSDCDGSGEAAGMISCDAAMDCETSSTDDELNCGACANDCGSANTDSVMCTDGACAFACTDPYRHCSTDDSTGCETNVAADPENCGSCGHSCLGGACVSGSCQARLIGGDPASYTGLKSLYGITVAGGQLVGVDWYSTFGLVYTLPLGGHSDRHVDFVAKAPLVFGGGVGGRGGDGAGSSYDCPATVIASDGADTALWGIFRDSANCPPAGVYEYTAPGGVPTTRQIVDFPPDPANNNYSGGIGTIAADATYVYYSQFWRWPWEGNRSGLFRFTRSSGAIDRYHDTHGIDSIFVQAGTVYWADYNSRTLYAASPEDLGNAVDLATTTNPPGMLQADATYLYYFEDVPQSGGVDPPTPPRFFRVNKLTRAVQEITPTNGIPTTGVHMFLVDSTYVYMIPSFIDPGAANNLRIYYFRKDGTSTSATVLTNLTDNPYGFTQDGSALYWATYGRDGAGPPFSGIYRIAKPAP